MISLCLSGFRGIPANFFLQSRVFSPRASVIFSVYLSIFLDAKDISLYNVLISNAIPHLFF